MKWYFIFVLIGIVHSTEIKWDYGGWHPIEGPCKSCTLNGIQQRPSVKSESRTRRKHQPIDSFKEEENAVFQNLIPARVQLVYLPEGSIDELRTAQVARVKPEQLRLIRATQNFPPNRFPTFREISPNRPTALIAQSGREREARQQVALLEAALNSQHENVDGELPRVFIAPSHIPPPPGYVKIPLLPNQNQNKGTQLPGTFLTTDTQKTLPPGFIQVPLPENVAHLSHGIPFVNPSNNPHLNTHFQITEVTPLTQSPIDSNFIPIPPKSVLQQQQLLSPPQILRQGTFDPPPPRTRQQKFFSPESPQIQQQEVFAPQRKNIQQQEHFAPQKPKIKQQEHFAPQQPNIRQQEQFAPQQPNIRQQEHFAPQQPNIRQQEHFAPQQPNIRQQEHFAPQQPNIRQQEHFAHRIPKFQQQETFAPPPPRTPQQETPDLRSLRPVGRREKQRDSQSTTVRRPSNFVKIGSAVIEPAREFEQPTFVDEPQKHHRFRIVPQAVTSDGANNKRNQFSPRPDDTTETFIPVTETIETTVATESTNQFPQLNPIPVSPISLASPNVQPSTSRGVKSRKIINSVGGRAKKISSGRDRIQELEDTTVIPNRATTIREHTTMELPAVTEASPVSGTSTLFPSFAIARQKSRQQKTITRPTNGRSRVNTRRRPDSASRRERFGSRLRSRARNPSANERTRSTISSTNEKEIAGTVDADSQDLKSANVPVAANGSRQRARGRTRRPHPTNLKNKRRRVLSRVRKVKPTEETKDNESPRLVQEDLNSAASAKVVISQSPEISFFSKSRNIIPPNLKHRPDIVFGMRKRLSINKLEMADEFSTTKPKLPRLEIKDFIIPNESKLKDPTTLPEQVSNDDRFEHFFEVSNLNNNSQSSNDSYLASDARIIYAVALDELIDYSTNAPEPTTVLSMEEPTTEETFVSEFITESSMTTEDIIIAEADAVAVTPKPIINILDEFFSPNLIPKTEKKDGTIISKSIETEVRASAPMICFANGNCIVGETSS